MCDIRDVKVVILGQDPYHGPNQAHGLCFSVQRPVPPPPSLENIYKELSTDVDGFVHPGHGDLSGWAKQGVLLLNAVLTVRAHQANSHKERGWEQFTDAVVSWLNQNAHGLVFLLWGSYAQKKGSAIDRKRHHVLQTAHPRRCRCTGASSDAGISLKPTSCCRSPAKSPSTGRTCDLVTWILGVTLTLGIGVSEQFSRSCEIEVLVVYEVKVRRKSPL